MSVQRACDVCGYFRQDRSGNPTVKRYGLRLQTRVPGELRSDGVHPRYHNNANVGGIDLCPECWERIAKPKMRPEISAGHARRKLAASNAA